MQLRCLHHPQFQDCYTVLLGKASRGTVNFLAMNRYGDYYHGECEPRWIKAQHRRRIQITDLPKGPRQTLRNLGYLTEG